MHDQCIDMGISRASLEEHLVSSGYWLGNERRRRNAYVLSPSAYAVSGQQRIQLDALARALYASIERVSARLSTLGRSKHLTHEESFFLALAKNGVRGLQPPREHDGSIPPVIKVDLMQSSDGSFKIAEADVYNPRGFGYLALLDATIPAEFARVGSGMSGLAGHVARVANGAQVPIIVSTYETYYEPTYQILAHALLEQGIHAGVLREEDLAGKPFIIERIRALFSIPDTLFARPSLREHLLDMYRGGQLRTYMPPAAYLGSKAFLPAYAECPTVAEFMPKTVLLGRRHANNIPLNGSGMLLKGVVSSGHKNIVFSRKDPDGFVHTFETAQRQRNPLWILQEEVQQSPVPIVVFDGDDRVTREYFVRLTAYIERAGLLGLEVTGREDGFVHGAPDCIQIPCVHV